MGDEFGDEIVATLVGALETRDSHHYLSTGCFHGEHAYCQSMTGQQGTKRPGQCKFCDARCVCPCHTENGDHT